MMSDLVRIAFEREAVALRSRGLTLRQIAEEMGYKGTSCVRNHLDRAERRKKYQARLASGEISPPGSSRARLIKAFARREHASA